jgi:retinol dehydrogenase 12
MKDKIVVVTGATAGIGQVAACELASQGAQVWVISRNEEKCVRVAAEIRQKTGNNAVMHLAADLSSQVQVRRAAAQLRESLPRIDVLMNNAGAIYDKRSLSADGIEMTWALNHLSYFLLTIELLPLLRAAPTPRVVNVSSGAHFMARNGVQWDDVQFARSYSGWRAYGQSKLANILFSNELARRAGVASNALHPGSVNTGFGRNNTGLFWTLFGKAVDLFTMTAEEGAKTGVYLASSPEVEGVSGKYFDKCKTVTPSAAARDVAAAERLWVLSEEMTAQG